MAVTQKPTIEKTLHQNTTATNTATGSNNTTIMINSQMPPWALLYRHIEERRHGRRYLTAYCLTANYLSTDLVNFARACYNEGIEVLIKTNQGDLNLDDYRGYDDDYRDYEATGYARAYLKLAQLQRNLNSAQAQVSAKQFDYSYLSEMKKQVHLKHSEEYLLRKLKRYAKIFDIEVTDDIAQLIAQVYDLSVKPSAGSNCYTEQMEILQGLYYLDNCIRPPLPKPRESNPLPWWAK